MCLGPGPALLQQGHRGLGTLGAPWGTAVGSRALFRNHHLGRNRSLCGQSEDQVGPVNTAGTSC